MMRVPGRGLSFPPQRNMRSCGRPSPWDTSGGGELHNRRKDGTLYWESVSISPIRDATGEIVHFLAVKEDITDKKQMEANYLRAQRLEGIGALASGIAHDLNNILAPVLMIAPLLRGGGQGGRRSRDARYD